MLRLAAEISKATHGLDLDISGKSATVVEGIRMLSDTRKWIKLIALNQTIPLDDFRLSKEFDKVADIALDTDVHSRGKKEGEKKRQTMIMFNPTITREKWTDKKEWLYMFVMNDRIVKIGGTRTGLQNRAASYLCGHHVGDRGKSGDCSKTNGYIYNTFEFYIKLGCKIEMYGYELPVDTKEIDFFGKKVTIVSQNFTAYESLLMSEYKDNYDKYPVLNDNCDPRYRYSNHTYTRIDG
jgi:hypothetical protein